MDKMIEKIKEHLKNSNNKDMQISVYSEDNNLIKLTLNKTHIVMKVIDNEIKDIYWIIKTKPENSFNDVFSSSHNEFGPLSNELEEIKSIIEN